MLALASTPSFFLLARQEIVALPLESVDLPQHCFDVFALLLQDGAAFLEDLKETLELRVVVPGGVIHVDQLADLHQREAETLASHREFEANPVTVTINSRPAG